MWVVGCGDDDGAASPDADSAIDASGGDAGTLDAGSVDGGGNRRDAMVGADSDGDGVPVELDCDDSVASIGRTGTRACTGECAPGTQTCTDGTWSSCSAPTDCACPTAGMMRTVPCGRCGLASQRCGADLRWEMPSACLDEQECFVAAIETDTAMCGMRTRICDDTCHWRPWTVMTPPGECAAGAMDVSTMGCAVGEARPRTCTDACTWMLGDCVVTCARAAHSSRTGADPVCIPAGPFILGAADDPRWMPVTTVTLSEFYIDRYPVTKQRYDQCIATGVCPAPYDPVFYGALAMDSYAAGFRDPDAITFCTWDGGTLPTEYQWEKAARGAAPSAPRNSWGDADGDCMHHPWMGCATVPFAITPTAFPAAVSPYGVRLMGSWAERTSTYFHYDHTGTAAIDPTGPATGTRYQRRGFEWVAPPSIFFVAPSATSRDSNGLSVRSMFRCAY